MNSLLTIGMIAKRGMFVLKNTCAVLPLVNSEYQKEYAITGKKIGDKITIPKPPQYEIRTGQQAKLQGTTEPSVVLTLDLMAGIDTPFSMKERTLTLDQYSKKIAEPKMAKIANHIDRYVLQLGQKIPNCVGTPGTTPTALLTYSQAGALLADLGEPQDRNRHVVMTPDMHAIVTGSTGHLGIFNPQGAVAEAYRTGLLAYYGGRRYWMDQNCPTHTVGALGGTPLVNGPSQSGTSLITDGWTAAAATRVKAGDIFTIADVYSVNPQSKDSTKKLRQFVALADGASDGSGNMTLSIAPEIIPSGAFQNVDAAPANNAALTFVGTASTAYRYGLAFHRGFAFVAFVDLELPPKGVVEAYRVVDDDTGISMSVVTGYDVIGGQTITRQEVLGGACIGYEDLGCRIWQL